MRDAQVTQELTETTDTVFQMIADQDSNTLPQMEDAMPVQTDTSLIQQADHAFQKSAHTDLLVTTATVTEKSTPEMEASASHANISQELLISIQDVPH